MEPIQIAADHCIRRALGFAGLGVGTVMLALSFDLTLALRSGAGLLAIVAFFLLFWAWRAQWHDIRRSEAWAEFSAMQPELARILPRGEAQRLVAPILQRRLMWHAERLAVAAIGLWALALLTALARGM